MVRYDCIEQAFFPDHFEIRAECREIPTINQMKASAEFMNRVSTKTYLVSILKIL